MQILAIRHPPVNLESGICYGQSDVPSIAPSIKELEDLKNALNHFSPSLVVSSPLIRCSNLAEQLGYSYKLDPRLMELNFGSWELKKWSELEGTAYENWLNNYLSVKTLNGESFTDLLNRVTSFIKESKANNHKKIALITHGGVIRVLYYLCSQANLGELFSIKVNYLSAHSFEY